MNTLLLLSGGIDSALCLAANVDRIAACVGFDYGQPHLRELERAADLAGRYGKPFEVVTLPRLPLVNDVVFAARNAVMLSVAAAMAQARGLDQVMIGANAADRERFLDCRGRFFDALDNALFVAYGVRVSTPLLEWAKADIVARAREIGLPLDLTLSCYHPNGPCGECLACRTRAEAGA